MNLLEENLDRWAIFDLGDHPLRTYHKGRLVMSGDAAHATSPHHGAGAGFCVEDSAVMAELLDAAAKNLRGETKMSKYDVLEASFATFEAVRKERTQWFVQSSRLQGDLYEWRAEGYGLDIEMIHRKAKECNDKIWKVNVKEMAKEAVEKLDKRFN
ncbi:hypothetical protein MMC13_001978 [Lambiella insularis]|nr:hypothetical protein [Lambiella insularis]